MSMYQYVCKVYFLKEEHIAIDAAEDLNNALCHQHVCLYNAALPAYEILLYCLQTTNRPALQEALLDLFFGFATCTAEIQHTWAAEIRQKLKRDRSIFQHFLQSETEIIAELAGWIEEVLHTETI